MCIRRREQRLSILTLLAALAWTLEAAALPVAAPYVDDPRCDPVGPVSLTDELGETGIFPAGEALSPTIVTNGTGSLTCVAGNGDLLDDWLVTITNLTATSWRDVFFVADPGISVGNADGTIFGDDAFRIDTVGLNTPLLFESMTPDGFFEPGETWDFLVVDFVGPPTVPPPGYFGPDFVSLGIGAASIGDPIGSNSSIVARVVPEPASAPLVGLGLLGLSGYAAHRRRRSKRA